MKRTLLFLSCILFALNLYAQSPVTFTLVKPPCDSDGILVASYTGSTPLDINWMGGTNDGIQIHYGVTRLTDTLYRYNGGLVWVRAISGTTVVDTGWYYGAPPFFFKFSSTPSIGTAKGTASVSVIGGTAPYSYYWFMGPYISAYQGSGNPISLPAGIYGVAVTDAAGCWFSSSINADSLDTVAYVSSSLAVRNSPSSSSFRVFPIPARATLNVELDSPLPGIADIQLSDVSGMLRIAEKVQVQAGHQVLPLNAGELDNGIYIVKLLLNDDVYYKQVVLQK